MTTAAPSASSMSQRKIAVSTSDGTYLFHPAEITRLQASSNYTFIHFVNRKPLLISKVLKTYEQLLGPMGFIRTHQSHLVNAQYIRFMDRQGAIEMLDATRIEVSRSKRKSVLDAIRRSAAASSGPDLHLITPPSAS